ncbi:MAG: RNA-guided pseudouridylation complex pseudouridine synthase subunit Cbf5 [Thermoplasmata archaeon]
MNESASPVPFPAPVVERVAAGAFLLIDKPRGPSSHQVTAWVRDLLRVNRAGHAGTLDPNVSGLLWVGVGPALKLIPLVLEFPKRYVAVMALHGTVSPRDLERGIAEFTGPIFQTPPVRSAVKRERRIRTIHRMTLLEQEGNRLLLDVTADSGTYIRSLAVDLGEAWGVGGNLEELRRIQTGPFREAGSIPLTALADATAEADRGQPEALLRLLHPMNEVWNEFPTIVLRDAAASAVAHGADLASGGISSLPRPFGKEASVVLVTRTGALVALGTALFDSAEILGIRHGWVVDSTRVFADPARFPAQWGQSATPKKLPASG